ncbi:Colicin-E7 immunity protein [Vibrio sp. B1FIG11]|uniref:bacteriocin immunity protein n=1 Tax=Vibrio TaxID=662 RepID=UPI001AF54956|nr:bacteriocin immunity protein [Vibrio sp. B1FIG11]CAD7797511.1 Colicin-E7 immunity protein [Vibrio sp. B1FIG11]CAD7800826.1 Colicin-E7 immunity protein [Vibrio sp. B1FIG11]CAD7801808.1 Colicin-E7 immunity protein [Vibrio sp. B1FIG11]CAD7803157.1 Colicin-E7 immunity protein [Vibrio sp. B1FIG11]CAE6880070.1 Colicin-E7 immunity protein [Vibrio sp. B1FIG11]
MSKKSITDYNEAEFLRFVEDIFKENASDSDEVLDELLDIFEEITEHPAGSDLIYYPENPGEDTPEGIVKIVKDWRVSQGLPCFKE